jgi:hypothetical protein
VSGIAVLAAQETTGTVMFEWLRTRVVNWLGRRQQRLIDVLRAEHRALKAKRLELNGPKPIRLSAEQRKRLAAMRKKLDPNALRAIDALDLTDSDSPDNS